MRSLLAAVIGKWPTAYLGVDFLPNLNNTSEKFVHRLDLGELFYKNYRDFLSKLTATSEFLPHCGCFFNSTL